MILKGNYDNRALIVRYVTKGREDKFINKYQIVLEIHPTNLEIFLYFWQKIGGIRCGEYRLWISNLSVYLVQYKQQTDRTTGQPTTPTQVVALAQTTHYLSQSSVWNTEISSPHPLRPTPLAFSSPHQHRQWDQAISQTTEYIPLVHQQPQLQHH
jgi:hypothetical protein